MQLFKRIFKFYLEASIHVALGVVALTLLTLERFELPVNIDFLGFVFFGTITGYNFVKYAGVAGLHHRHLTETLQVIQFFSLGCFLVWAYFAIQFDLRFWLSCIPLALLTLFYAIPLLPGFTNLRHMPSLKIFVIAAVWAGVTVFLPTHLYGLLVDWEVGGLLIQQFLLVLALIIPFEIRDLRYDSKKLATLPQLIGIQKTKVVGYFILMAYMLVSFFLDRLSPKDLAINFLFVTITALAIFKSNGHNSPYYASFWVEGIPIYCWIFSLGFYYF